MLKNRTIVLLIIGFFASCDSGTNAKVNPKKVIPEALLGYFTDDYEIPYSISDSLWIMEPGTRYHLISYNEKEQYFIARNDDQNEADGGLYTRIDVTFFTGMEPYLWGFCLTTWNAKTVAEVSSTMAADRDHPKTGCGGFPFSRMKRRNR